MTESGTSSVVEKEDLMRKYPACTGSGTATRDQANKKDRDEDMKAITFKPCTTCDGDTKKRKLPANKLKDPNAPKRPLNAFILFQNSIVSQKKRDNLDMQYQELHQEISRRWGDMSVEEKKSFQGATEIAKVDYERSKTEYETGLTTVAALEIHVLGVDGSDEARSRKSNSALAMTSTNKVVDKKKAAKVAVAPPALAASLDHETSVDGDEDEDETDSNSEDEEEEGPLEKKIKNYSSPSRARRRTRRT